MLLAALPGVQGLSDGNGFTVPRAAVVQEWQGRRSGSVLQGAGCCIQISSSEGVCVFCFRWQWEEKDRSSVCQRLECVCPAWGCGPRAALRLQKGFPVCHCQLSSAGCAPGSKGSSLQSAGAGGAGRAAQVMVWALVTRLVECEQTWFHFRASCSNLDTEKCKVLLHAIVNKFSAICLNSTSLPLRGLVTPSYFIYNVRNFRSTK